MDNQKRTADESFEIKLRNHKKEPVEIRVIESLALDQLGHHAKSDPFTKTDAQTIEFRIALNPDQEKIVTYTTRYTQLRFKEQTPLSR